MNTFKQILILILITLSVYIWKDLYAETSASLLIAAYYYVLIIKSSVENKSHQKRSFSNYYFKEGSFLNKIIKGKILLYVIYPILSVVSIYFLMSFMATLEIKYYYYMLVDVLLIYLMYKIILNRIKDSSNEKTLIFFSKKASVFINMVLMSMLFLYFQMNSIIPEISLGSFSDMGASLSLIEYSDNIYINDLLYSYEYLNHLNYWLMINLGDYFSILGIKYAMWSIFLIQNGIVFNAFGKVVLESYEFYWSLNETK